jgi:hypothetical protein
MMDARASKEGIALASNRKELGDSTEDDTADHEPHRLQDNAEKDDGQ